MGKLTARYDIKAVSRSPDYAVSERELAETMQAFLTAADAPAGRWRMDIQTRVTCRGDSPWMTCGGEAVQGQPGSYRVAVRMSGGSEYRYEGILSFDSGRMTPDFTVAQLSQAAAVYSALMGEKDTSARQRAALAALPVFLPSEEPDAQSAAALAAELGLPQGVPARMVVRLLVVDGALLPCGEGYVATDPNRKRLGAALGQLSSDLRDKLPTFLRAVETVEGETIEEVRDRPFLDLELKAVGLPLSDLQVLWRRMPGLVLGFGDGHVSVHRAMAGMLRKVLDKARVAATAPKAQANGATVPEDSRPPKSDLERARERYGNLEAAYQGASQSLARLHAQRAEDEAELVRRRQVVADLEAQLVEARSAVVAQDEKIVHQDDLITAARLEERHAENAVLEAQDEVIALEHEERLAREVESQAQRETLLRMLEQLKMSPERAAELLAKQPAG